MNKYIVRTETGEIDIANSILAFENAIKSLYDEEMTLKEKVVYCVDEIFAKPKKVAIPTLVSMVLGKLSPTVDNYQKTMRDVEIIIKNLIKGGYLVSVKGKNGGVTKFTGA